MVNYIVEHTEAGGYNVAIKPEGQRFMTTIANFSNDAAGEIAYNIFVAGVARLANASTVYDQDRQCFIVGTVEQLVA